MSCKCKPTGAYCENCAALYEDGKMVGTLQLLALLEEHGALRNSMLGGDWRVLYTETGAKDVKFLDLIGYPNE
jgi:hypothetical protein